MERTLDSNAKGLLLSVLAGRLRSCSLEPAQLLPVWASGEPEKGVGRQESHTPFHHLHPKVSGDNAVPPVVTVGSHLHTAHQVPAGHGQEQPASTYQLCSGHRFYDVITLHPLLYLKKFLRIKIT